MDPGTRSILSDLAKRYLYRKPLASVRIDEETKNLLPKLKSLIKQAGFNPDYYTATNSAFDEPYDAYKPTGKMLIVKLKLCKTTAAWLSYPDSAHWFVH